MAKVGFSLTFNGVDKIAELDGRLERAERSMLSRTARGIRDAIRRHAPGGPQGRAGRAVRSRVLSASRALVGSFGFPGAKALERCAWIAPKHK